MDPFALYVGDNGLDDFDASQYNVDVKGNGSLTCSL